MENKIRLVSIFNPAVARALLRRGYAIKDIKADKKNRQRTIFLFEYSEALYDNITAIHRTRLDERAASQCGVELGVFLDD